MLPPARSTGVNLLGRLRGGHSAEEAYLREWARSHAGVEAFVEPRTAVTETTVLLVAADGEWTRRRVAGPNAARRLAHRLAIPRPQTAAQIAKQPPTPCAASTATATC